MKKTLLQTILLVSGIILIFAGVTAILNPAPTIVSIAFVLGLALFISGLFSIIFYIITKKYNIGGIFVLIDGIITIIVGTFILCNKYITATAIPFIFGMWILFSGITRLINSFDIKRCRIKFWWCISLVGLGEIILGFTSFFNPIIAAFTISVIVGMFLIAHGISTICFWIFIRQIEKM